MLHAASCPRKEPAAALHEAFERETSARRQLRSKPGSTGFREAQAEQHLAVSHDDRPPLQRLSEPTLVCSRSPIEVHAEGRGLRLGSKARIDEPCLQASRLARGPRTLQSRASDS